MLHKKKSQCKTNIVTGVLQKYGKKKHKKQNYRNCGLVFCILIPVVWIFLSQWTRVRLIL